MTQRHCDTATQRKGGGKTAKSQGGGVGPVLLVLSILAAWSACAVFFFFSRGSILYYGDAEAHLNIARRILDSRTPGYDQIGTVWLPLPHALMLPFISNDALWRSGLAGSIPSAFCFVIAGAFLFATIRRLFGSTAAAVTATALLALNPNVLYLQSTPMTEPIFLAGFLALLYFSVWFRQSESPFAVIGAGIACLWCTLTRYEGWFLIPAVTLYFLIAAKRNRLRSAILFGALASLGPLYWMAHNWWFFGDGLAFYRGPWSAQAIQGAVPYPGKGDWRKALDYYGAAVRWCAGYPLLILGTIGLLAALLRKALWPVLLLALPGLFYVWSVHSSGTPIFVPDLWPHSHYNTRYGMAVLPLAALAASALVSLIPERRQRLAALLVVLAATAPWLLHPREDAWVTWKEAQVNSTPRRAWTGQAAAYLGPRYKSGSGIFTQFGDLTGIYRGLGIPLKETLTTDNEPHWQAAVARPDLFLWEEWAVTMGGEPVQSGINRARRRGPNYELVKIIVVKRAQVIEIYRRAESPLHGPR
ncbi:MAG: glycosyltransferase family 39 protein [Acidobacteria bacterium]|nr:glycosyltransferase family 39 protein [Acidobacteriota bacterium]